MNHQRILEHFADKVLALGLTGITRGDVNLPNTEFERKDRGLWFEISVGEGEPLNYAECTDRRFITVNVILGVPLGSGTARLNNCAEKVSRIYTPNVSRRAGFIIGDNIFVVRGVTKYPAETLSDGVKLNVRFTLEKYTKEE